jgi:replicative DNA helicase
MTNNNIIDYSEDLENYILNQLIYFSSYFKDFVIKIKRDYFFFQQSKEVYNILCDLFFENKAISSEIVLEIAKIKNENLYKYVLDILFLDNSKSLEILNEQCKQLETYYYKRLIKSETYNLLSRIKDYNNPDQLLRDIQYTTSKISGNFTIKEKTDISDLLDLFEKEDEILETGFSNIDSFTSIKKNELIIIGARPSIGKSAFALNLAVNIAKKKPVLFLSMEMSQKEIINRIYSILSNRIRYDILNDRNILNYTKEKAGELKLNVVDKPISIDDINTYLIKGSSEFAAVFIDYLQLISISNRKEVNRYNDVSEISRKLKLLTMQFNIPIIALSQLNRGVELRTDKKPVLSDLRESGSLEQDANQVWLLHRENFYNTETKDNCIELIVAKNRSGATGSIKLGFDAQKYKLFNYVN